MATDPKVIQLMQLASANQEVAAEKRRKYETSPGDFEGVVHGNWIKMTENGGGIVEYKAKKYSVVIQAQKSIPEGTRVSLEYRNGYYIASW